MMGVGPCSLYTTWHMRCRSNIILELIELTSGEVPRAEMDYKVPENNPLSAETLGQYPTSPILSSKRVRGKPSRDKHEQQV